MQHFLQGKGALMASFAFLPFVGEAIAIALGFMRSNRDADHHFPCLQGSWCAT